MINITALVELTRGIRVIRRHRLLKAVYRMTHQQNLAFLSDKGLLTELIRFDQEKRV